MPSRMPGIALTILAALLLMIAASWAPLRESGTIVRAATTTSLYQTGLLDALASAYRSWEPSVTIHFLPVGSGEALERAARGDACVVFVHAPSLEKEYIGKGAITMHRIIAFNYFVILGPPNDPAGVREARDPIDAFKRIYMAGERGEAVFVSRGDNSGTHVRELMLWSRAGLDPRGKPWYRETGQGMAETLVVASEMGAYTLSDIGTYLRLSKEGRIPGLTILYDGGSELINIYSVYLASPCGGAERRAAESLISFVSGPLGQEIIARFGVDKYGRPLFYKAEGNLTWLEEEWEKLAGGG